MKRYWIIIGLLALLLIGIEYRSNQLQSQLLNMQESPQLEKITDTSECKRFQEDLANECYQKLANVKKDASVCDQISKESKKSECLQDVQFFR